MANPQYSGAAAGAASGAAIGTMILPGIGTAVGAILGGAAGYFSSKQDKGPSVHAGRLKRKLLSFYGTPGVREATGPVAESRSFARGADVAQAGRAEAERRLAETAARYRLGPGALATGKLKADVATGAATGAARGAAGERRTAARLSIDQQMYQGLFDIEALKHASDVSKATRLAQANRENMAALGSAAGSLATAYALKPGATPPPPSGGAPASFPSKQSGQFPETPGTSLDVPGLSPEEWWKRVRFKYARPPGPPGGGSSS